MTTSSGRIFLIALVVALAAGSGILAATPPARVNYQGVLRDSSGTPLNGTFDLVFRFHSAATGGDEVLVDTHSAATMTAVTVTNGLFNVTLGGGVVADGSGPGSFLNLTDLFANYSSVWMGIEVNSQLLLPRIPFESSPYALNAGSLEGKPAASFLDTSTAFQFKTGPVAFDGASDPNRSAVRVYGGGNRALLATNTNGVGSATLSNYDAGIRALGRYGLNGPDAAGVFSDTDGTALAFIAPGVDGIITYGVGSGGVFRRGVQGSYTTEATLATAEYGIDATGPTLGGRFRNLANSSARVDLAGTTGSGSYGISASGSEYAGEFLNDPFVSGTYLSTQWGIQTSGTLFYGAGAGQFRDSFYWGHVQLARGDVGVVAYGTAAAGVFRHGFENGWDSWAHLADGSSALIGAGAKNFVQNHPYDPDAEIVYTALEGDEVGTYTRGSAILEHGVARVKLGRSFSWVTNPDIGLTATVTPRGVPVPLAVESVSTTELVVRAETGARDVVFDYVVQGLRAGFERFSVVRPKREDAPIPPMTEHMEVYAAHPELEEYNALERFAALPDAVRGGKKVDLARSEALVAAIGTGDMSKPPVRRRSMLTPEHAAQWERDHPGKSLAEAEAHAVEPASPANPGQPRSSPFESDRSQPEPATARDLAPVAAVRIQVAEPVEPGDVLVNDAARPGDFVRAREAGDRGVIGIVTGEPGARFLAEAPVALAGMVVPCRVDATEFPIGANDLLMASSLVGHAMRAGENPRQGTVIGKALEPLEAGTGVIKVLVMSR